MTDADQLVIEGDDKRMIEILARREGISTAEYVRRHLTSTPRPSDRWQAGLGGAPPAAAAPARPAPKTLEETLAESAARMTQLAMARQMPGMFGDWGGNGKALTAEDVTRIVDDRMGRRRGNDEGEDDSKADLRYIKSIQRMRMATKMIGGEDDSSPRWLEEMNRQRAEEKSRHDELMAHLDNKEREELHARDEAQEKARNEMFERLHQDALAATQRVEQQILTLRGKPDQPKSEIDNLIEGISRLDSIRGKLDTLTGGSDKRKPWWIDEIKDLINVAGDNAGKVLEGYGHVEAGRAGLPPPGQMPQGPEGTVPVYRPDYAEPGSAPIPPPNSADPFPQLAGYRADPSDLSSWPDVPYWRNENNQQIPMAKADFVQQYGAMIYARRKAAGVIPSPTPPAAAPAAPTPTSAEVDTMAAIHGAPPRPRETPRAPPPMATPPATVPPSPPTEPAAGLSDPVWAAMSGGAPLEAPPPAPTAPPSSVPAAGDTPVEQPVTEADIPPGAFGQFPTSMPRTIGADGTVTETSQ